MPFSIEFSGFDDLAGQIDRLGEKAQSVAAQALYEGAKVVADAVSRGMQGISTEKFKFAAGGRKRKPSPEEKALVLQARHGVAKFEKTGISVETSVGFQNAGYGKVAGASKPIPQVVNSINSGTSFMEKQPFLRKAFSQSNGAATAAIESGINSRLDEITMNE